MIRELEQIVLTRDIPDSLLRAGDVGVVVHVYPNDMGFEVEFLTLSGKTRIVQTLPSSMARPVAGTDVLHVRSIAPDV